MVRAEASYLTYNSPIPPPEILAGYNAVIPGGAERILAMAEKQTDHRIDIEKQAVGGENFRATAGIFAALVIALSGLWTAYSLAMNGHEATAIAVAGMDFASLVGAFVFGRLHQAKERVEKAKIMAGQNPNA